MNFEFFIARRIFFAKESKKGISDSVISIAVFGIALGMAVMILSVAIVTGFKEEVRKKVTGFGSHVLIGNLDNNNSFEANPIEKNQDFVPVLKSTKGIKHIQVFATKAGIIKTNSDIQGVVLKGVGEDYDWSFFNENILQGECFKVTAGKKTDNVIISRFLASMLKLKIGDPLYMYFIHDPIKMKRFTISGIYSTDLQEFDKLYVICDIAHVQKLNDWSSNQVNGFEVLVNDFDKVDEMATIVNNKIGTIYSENTEMFSVTSIKEIYPQIFDWLELTDTNVWVILGLMIVVSIFNMISGLFVIILEKTNMIGILKALGTNNFSICKIFLYNAAFLISKGLFLGNLIGIGLGLIQSWFKIIKLDPSTYYIDSAPVNFKIWHILLLNLATLVITVLMLVVPSLIISKIKPAKAIRFA
ncbi:MAG: FtsX-like permease family protein [Bacteroidales bacterium]